VGAVIGYGIFAGSLNWQNLSRILLSWLVSPIVGFFLSYIIVRFFDRAEIARTNSVHSEKSKNWLYALRFGAVVQEFWQGANNIGNATSFLSATFEYPLVSRALGGIFLAIGLMTLGVRVLSVAGLRIARLPIHAAFGTQLVIVTLNIIGTLYGLPISGTHISVSCLIGAGLACKTKIDYSIVRKVFLYWFLTLPGAASITMAVAYVSTLVFV
jgi:phosphate/sulfate permease